MKEKITKEIHRCDVCHSEMRNYIRVCPLCDKEICDACVWVYGDFQATLDDKTPKDIFHTNICVNCFKIPEVREALKDLVIEFKNKTSDMIKKLRKIK